MTDIIHNNGEKFGEFSAKHEGESAGILQYEWLDENTINIVHTETYEHFEGKGIGKDLLYRAVDFAREKDLKIKATCPFAHSVLEKDASVKDLFLQ